MSNEETFESKCDTKLQDFVMSDEQAKKLEFDRRDDDKWKILVKKWNYAKSDLYCAQEIEKMARDELIEAANGRSCRGSGISVKKIVKKGRVNYSSIPALIGIDIEKYREDATEYWRISEEGDAST